MNIHHIYYAAEVARYGSINKAASCLFISQSALSRSIKELEEELGFQLFIRTPNGVLPTHQGQEFLRRAQRLNDQYIALREQYYTNQQLPVVQLSFAAIRCVIVELLLIQLYRRYQDRQYLNLCVCEERVGKVIDHVYDGLYSVGLILVEESQREAVLQKCRRRDLAWVPVSKHPVYLQVGTGHPLAGRAEVYLLDEVTSALDPENARLVEELLLREDACVIHVCHKPVPDLDRLYDGRFVMEAGRLSPA